MDILTNESNRELMSLCNIVRMLILDKKYEQCGEVISEAMGKYPSAPEPHNLMGILFEKEGDHISAMKHFRAAWALDPAYIPVRHNLERFGSFYAGGKCAFDESDCSTVIGYDVKD